ncbi:hypothetical protein BGZ83_004784, partial [Gryganskiella cystojenkinii]
FEYGFFNMRFHHLALAAVAMAQSAFAVTVYVKYYSSAYQHSSFGVVTDTTIMEVTIGPYSGEVRDVYFWGQDVYGAIMKQCSKDQVFC